MSGSVAEKTDPVLWERLKQEMKEKNDGKWSARLSQQLVLRYKRIMEQRGQKPFVGKKRKDNSLAKWTREQWQYISPTSRRYLPKKLIEQLTPIEKQRLSRGKVLGEHTRWDDSVRFKIVSFLQSRKKK